jgi:hypothetical protein
MAFVRQHRERVNVHKKTVAETVSLCLRGKKSQVGARQTLPDHEVLLSTRAREITFRHVLICLGPAILAAFSKQGATRGTRSSNDLVDMGGRFLGNRRLDGIGGRGDSGHRGNRQTMNTIDPKSCGYRAIITQRKANAEFEVTLTWNPIPRDAPFADDVPSTVAYLSEERLRGPLSLLLGSPWDADLCLERAEAGEAVECYLLRQRHTDLLALLRPTLQRLSA